MALAIAAIVSLAILAYMFFNNRNMKTYNHYMKRKKRLEESLDFFSADELYSNQNVVMGINKKEKILAISTMKNGNPCPLTFDFADIIDCEIVEEKADPLVKQAKAENLGSVLGNSVGQVLGKEEADRISRIDLKIHLKDSQTPYVLANFLLWEVGKDSEEYKVVLESKSHWYKMIKNNLPDHNLSQINAI